MINEYKFKDEVLKGKMGDEQALETLIEKLQPMIKAACCRHSSKGNKGYEYEELYQEACIAVLEAVRQFDPGWGLPFLYFAKKKVGYHLLNYCRKPLTQITLYAFEDETTCCTLIENLESCQGVNEDMILNSLVMQKSIKRLTKKQERVINMHYYQEKSLKRISEELNLHYQSVVKLKARALKKLKVYLKSVYK